MRTSVIKIGCDNVKILESQKVQAMNDNEIPVNPGSLLEKWGVSVNEMESMVLRSHKISEPILKLVQQEGLKMLEGICSADAVSVGCAAALAHALMCWIRAMPEKEANLILKEIVPELAGLIK